MAVRKISYRGLFFTLILLHYQFTAYYTHIPPYLQNKMHTILWVLEEIDKMETIFGKLVSCGYRKQDDHNIGKLK